MSITFGSRAPKILVVDDEPAILDILTRRLQLLGCEIATLSGGTGVADQAKVYEPDIILLDVMMPDVDGFSVLAALKADPDLQDIPVVMMTAKSEIESRVKGLDLGAHDYISKPYETTELVARIRAALRVKQLQDSLKQANRELERLATSDPLTDLPNRRTFDEQFLLAVERTRRSGEPLSVLMLDLDHFKRINDTYGHQVGDEALREVGRLLSSRRRITDLVARYGGEEFVWVLPGALANDAIELAEWVRRMVGAISVQTDQGPVGLAVTVGVTTYVAGEHGAVAASTVLEVADTALREAKLAGRDRVGFLAIGAGPAAADLGPAIQSEQDAVSTASDAPGLTRYR
jgi:diguanylate cyclase (GGDEF)-like protein